MVATKAENAKKKNMKQGNAKKMKGRNKRVNLRAGIGAMFNPNQMMDNPGYMDFNEPDIRPPPPIMRPPVPQITNNSVNHSNKNKNQPNRRQQQTRRRQGGWMPPPNMPPGPPMINQRPLQLAGPFRGPMPPPRLHAMGPPMPPMRLPMPLMPPPPSMNGRYGPRPPMPLLMGRPPMPMPRPPPLGLGPMPPPRPLIPRSNSTVGLNSAPIRRNKNRRNNRNKKSKNQNNKKVVHNINVNKYPLGKPWVNDEIKNECKKKEDLEIKLKGNKNDELFAEFKVQRDKFVKMYEAARLEFIGKHPEQDIEKIMTESDKPETQTSINTNIAES